MANKSDTGTDIEKVFFDEQTLEGINGFQDALNAIANVFGDVQDASQVLGDGFAILQNKDKLVDTAFVILDWDYFTGEFGLACSMRVVTELGQKLRVNDGSTGIHQQLVAYEEKSGRKGGMIVNGGLRKSTYDTIKGVPCRDGEVGDGTGTTYYLAT